MASRDVQVRIGTLDQYLTPRAGQAILERLAMLAIGRIKRRTGQGKDVEGKTFVAYSKGYAKQRRESGRQASPPTLLLSGAMLGGMDILSADGQRAVIGFKGTAAAAKFTKRTRSTTRRFLFGATQTTIRNAPLKRKDGTVVTHAVSQGTVRVANALKAAWNDRGEGDNPRRHFFGLSREDRRFLAREGIKQVIEAVRQASLSRLSSAGALRKARLAGR